MGLYLERILAREAFQVVLSGAAGGVSGVLAGDFRVEGSAEWSGFDVNMLEGVANAAYSNVVTASNSVAGTGFKSAVFQTMMSYAQEWKGPSPMSLSVDIMQVNIDGKSPVSKLKDGLAGVFPESSAGGTGVRMVTAPLGYKRNSTPPLSLKVGTWFQADSVFVMGGYAITVSKEVDAYGTPLYASATVTLASAGLLTADMVAGFFVG